MQENAGGASGTEKQSRKKKVSENMRPMPPPSNYAPKNPPPLLNQEAPVNESFDNSARSKQNQ